MARFYFDFRQGRQLSPDNVGSEFPDAEKAYLEAFKAAQEMWGELMMRREDPRRCTFEIRDGDGHVLFVLPFLELLESCNDRTLPRRSIYETYQDTVEAAKLMQSRKDDFMRELEAVRGTIRDSANLLAAPV